MTAQEPFSGLLSLFLFYLAAVNAFAFVIYGVDKWKAKTGRWRVPESMLIFLAVIGGGAGALLGMTAFHHKTRKAKFFLGVPVILAAWILGLVFIFLHQNI